jgi:uncharacterized membrane protein
MASKAPKRSTDNTNGILAFLCYLLWPVALILLLLDKREGDLRFHSINGLGFGLAWWILAMIIGMVLGWMFWMFYQLVWILGLVYAIVLGIKAYNGEKPEIPVVTQFLRSNVKGL